MTHLGELLSALVDGELFGAELDRANAHLAACPACQAEAAGLRQLKRDLRSLGEAGPPSPLAWKLMLLAEPAGGGQDQSGPGDGGLVPARLLQPADDRRPRRRRVRGGDPLRPPAHSTGPGRHGRRRRTRYVLWSAVSLVVVGIGAAAFGMGGSPGASERPVTPQQLEVYDIQHAVNAGEVPFAEPGDASPAAPASPAVQTVAPGAAKQP